MTKDPGRPLRMLVGAREDILERLPGERIRYASLGGMVLGSGLMAALAMYVALHAVVGRFHPATVPAALLWGLFVVNLDRWLVSGSWPAARTAQLTRLLPRLLMALAIGVVVSESLLLSFFQTAIEAQVQQNRTTAVADRIAKYQQCNPAPGRPAAGALPAYCDSYRLLVPAGTLNAQLQEIASKQQEATGLQRTIATDMTAVAALEDQARRECNGTSGETLTGVRGEGPNCRRLRAQAAQYRVDHDIVDNSRRLAALNQSIGTLQAAVAGGQGDYQSTLEATIRADPAIAQLRGPVSILERYQALGDLVAGNPVAATMEWALRLFIIVLDIMPVLARSLSGNSAYDRLLRSEQDGEQRRASAAVDREIDLAQAEANVQKARAEAERRRLDHQEAEAAVTLQESILAGIERALHGPPPVNYDGWVGVSADVPLSAAERAVVLDAPGPFTLTVEIGPDRTGAVTERLLTDGGVDRPEVAFTVEVDSDHAALRRPGAELAVAVPGGVARVNFAFDLTDAHLAAVPWLWVRVSAGRRTLQNIELAIEVAPDLERG